jgi:hypothetical protein
VLQNFRQASRDYELIPNRGRSNLSNGLTVQQTRTECLNYKKTGLTLALVASERMFTVSRIFGMATPLPRAPGDRVNNREPIVQAFQSCVSDGGLSFSTEVCREARIVSKVVPS